MEKIAVIAGTLVDTRMGGEFLERKGIEVELYPVSKNPIEQTNFQHLKEETKENEIKKIISDIKYKGIKKIFVYCNSLSSAVDMKKISIEENIDIITPMNAYEIIANNYNNIGVIAANNKGLSGIEKVIIRNNKNCNVIGISMLPIVLDVETKKEPNKIILDNSLDLALKFFEKNNVESIILGCTHFSYFSSEIKNYTNLNIIDPSEMMYEILMKSK